MATTLLVDTHALLWWLSGDRRLPRRSRDRIADPENHVFASAVSAWEVAIKTALGKLDAPGHLVEAVEESGLSWMAVEPREAYAAGGLPMHHRDPFDRLLVAQSLERAVSIVSHDEVFDSYGVRRVWR
jgi:PIN domain nuclease of toxin-antitoxin system